MSSITAFTNTNTDDYNWAQEGVTVDDSDGLKLSSGKDSLKIPAELLPVVKNVLSRLKGVGADVPNLTKKSKLQQLTPKQMAMLATVAQAVKGALTPDTATAMMAISSERSELLNEVVKSSVEDMQARNQEISRLNNLLQEIRAKGPGKDEGDADWKSNLSGEAFRLLVENGWDEHIQANTNGSRSIWENYSYKTVVKVPKSEVPEDLRDYNTKPKDEAHNHDWRPSMHKSDKIVEALQKAGVEVNPNSYYAVSQSMVDGEWMWNIEELTVDLEMKDATNKFAELIQNIKTEIDDLSSSSQLDMVKLQGLINKKNQSVELMTTFQQKDGSLMDKLIGGINR